MSGAFHFVGGEVPRHRLDFAVERGPLHLRGIYRCIRDGGIGFATVPQRAGRFDMPTDRPHVVILGDDMHAALGPAAFHRKSVRRFAARCRTAAIVACEALPVLYTGPALTAMSMRWDGLIVETLPRWEASWADLIRQANPSITLLIGTVKPEGGFQ